MKSKIKMFVVFCLMVLCGMMFSSEAQAATKVTDFWQLDRAKSAINLRVKFNAEGDTAEQQTTLNLTEESYVGFVFASDCDWGVLMNYPMTLTIYKDNTPIKSFTYNYRSVENYASAVLSSGNYTIKATCLGQNTTSDIECDGVYSVKIGYMSTDDVIKVTPWYEHGKCVEVEVYSCLDSHNRDKQYRKGSVPAKYNYSSKYWNLYKVSFEKFTLDKKCSDNKCIEIRSTSININKTGNYTFRVFDEYGTAVTKICHIVVKDKTKPSVSGVKNNKTYKKKVTIKFSDSGTGIKSAKLNGKKIKSGYKVSKKGSYKLVVTDVAGNKTTINFKIKK